MFVCFFLQKKKKNTFAFLSNHAFYKKEKSSAFNFFFVRGKKCVFKTHTNIPYKQNFHFINSKIHNHVLIIMSICCILSIERNHFYIFFIH